MSTKGRVRVVMAGLVLWLVAVYAVTFFVHIHIGSPFKPKKIGGDVYGWVRPYDGKYEFYLGPVGLHSSYELPFGRVMFNPLHSRVTVNGNLIKGYRVDKCTYGFDGGGTRTVVKIDSCVPDWALAYAGERPKMWIHTWSINSVPTLVSLEFDPLEP